MAIERAAPAGLVTKQLSGELMRSEKGDPVEPSGVASRRMLITTGAVDREMDTINPEGWDVDRYLANPVVLWAHDRKGLPVARTTSIRRAESGLEVDFEFAPPEVNPLAGQVRGLLDGGFLTASSVGFLPTEWDWSKDPARKGGIDFKRVELTEWSFVTVPANPEALIQRAEKSLRPATDDQDLRIALLRIR